MSIPGGRLKEPTPHPCPPDDQWIVLFPQGHTPQDMSFVEYEECDLPPILTARFGPGRLSRTRTRGLLRWTPDRSNT